MARSHRRLFRRAAHRAVRSAGEDQADHPASGATATPTSRAPPTTACRCSPACCPTRSTRSARSRGNPCEGIKQLYSGDRSEIIWTDADIAQLKATCSPEIAHAVDLAAHTGLRLGDLLRLSWSHVGDDAIVIATGKSGERREAIIPLYDALRDVLARIPKRSTTILTNSRGRPWTKDGFSSSFNKAKTRAGMATATCTSTTCAGTAATKFYIAGLSERVIAEIMGWEEEHVARIIRRYVGRSAATKAIIHQLNQSRKENVNCKTDLQNRPPESGLSAGAGDGDRTHDIQLGKLTFYH